jgi:hypothetical protein
MKRTTITRTTPSPSPPQSAVKEKERKELLRIEEEKQAEEERIKKIQEDEETDKRMAVEHFQTGVIADEDVDGYMHTPKKLGSPGIEPGTNQHTAHRNIYANTYSRTISTHRPISTPTPRSDTTAFAREVDSPPVTPL